MEIQQLLAIGEHCRTDKEAIELIISNRITHFLGEKDGAAVGSKNFGTLADDILKWHESKIATNPD